MTKPRPYETPGDLLKRDTLYYEMGSSVLKNKQGITDPEIAAEQETIGFIQAQVILTNKLSKRTKFNANYIKTIHKLALQHLYPFAGRYRNVNLSKASHHFLPYQLFKMGWITLKMNSF